MEQKRGKRVGWKKRGKKRKPILPEIRLCWYHAILDKRTLMKLFEPAADRSCVLDTQCALFGIYFPTS
jgi:hypothetical protein